MKKLLILAAAATLILGSCGTGSSNLKNESDSLAYSVGVDLGGYIKNLDSTLNINIVAAAIKDVLANKPKMEQEATYAFLREYFTVRKPAKLKKESEDFLAKVEKDTKGIQKTESGLLYVVENAGSSVKATGDDDQVRVMYKGTLPDGKVFDSSYDRGDTAQFALNHVIKGWSEGMRLIGEGGKIKLWVPSELAYGAQGAGGSIGANQALVFEVELIQVIPADQQPEE